LYFRAIRSVLNYFVYIIYSAGTDTFYRGQTSNIEDRLRRHNAGREKFASRGTPWELVWCTEKDTRSEALLLERKLKNMSRDKLIKFMHRYKEECAGPDALILLDQWSGC
jgi:putative endonuclease